MLHDLAIGYTTNIQDVLCIIRAGIVPMQFAREGARVDVVEINPAAVPVAEKFFDLNPTQINLTFDDGRHFVNRSTKHYDAITLMFSLATPHPCTCFRARHSPRCGICSNPVACWS